MTAAEIKLLLLLATILDAIFVLVLGIASVTKITLLEEHIGD